MAYNKIIKVNQMEFKMIYTARNAALLFQNDDGAWGSYVEIGDISVDAIWMVEVDGVEYIIAQYENNDGETAYFQVDPETSVLIYDLQ